MTEYTVTINGGEPVKVMANDCVEAVERALCYGSDAVEFITEIF